MKNIKILLIFCTTFLIVLSCDDKDDTEVFIRLSNISSFDYKNITVNSTTYEDLNSGEKSEYKLFSRAYRYGFIELEIDEEIYTIQPIDYVGETPLKNGEYTYQINANDSQEQYGKLELTLIED